MEILRADKAARKEVVDLSNQIKELRAFIAANPTDESRNKKEVDIEAMKARIAQNQRLIGIVEILTTELSYCEVFIKALTHSTLLFT